MWIFRVETALVGEFSGVLHPFPLDCSVFPHIPGANMREPGGWRVREQATRATRGGQLKFLSSRCSPERLTFNLTLQFCFFATTV